MITLSPEQCRVIGVMLEKETTTPEQCPLSLNGIVTGCNQKSSREPVMALSESDVRVPAPAQPSEPLAFPVSDFSMSEYIHNAFSALNLDDVEDENDNNACEGRTMCFSVSIRACCDSLVPMDEATAIKLTNLTKLG